MFLSAVLFVPIVCATRRKAVKVTKMRRRKSKAERSESQTVYKRVADCKSNGSACSNRQKSVLGSGFSAAEIRAECGKPEFRRKQVVRLRLLP